MKALILPAVALLAPSLAAQDLAAAAERERERRQKAGQKGQTFTNADIDKKEPGAKPSPKPGESSSRSRSSPPSRLLGPQSDAGSSQPSTPSGGGTGCEGSECGERSPSGGNQQGEAYWKQRAENLRKAVADAEAKVAKVQKEIDGLRQGQMQPLPSDGIRQVPPDPLTGSADAAPLHAQLDAAKDELAKARQALADLDEEARKASVPPGWIR